MALQIWLPLNGNLHNQGLMTLPSPSYNTSSFINNGKIGKGISGTIHYHLSSEFITNEWSIAAWILFPDTYAEYNNIILCKNTEGSEDSQFYLSIVSNTYINIGRGSSGGLHYTLSGGFQSGTWYHCAATFDGTTTSLYLNGNLVNSGNIGSYKEAKNFCINGRATNTGGTASMGGCMKENDVRVYDHCLSPKEVKEISKCLVMHYKLDDPYMEGTINLFAGRTDFSDTTKWHKLQQNSIIPSVNSDGDMVLYGYETTGNHQSYIVSNNGGYIDISPETTYTLSLYVKYSSINAYLNMYFYEKDSSNANVKTNYQRMGCTADEVGKWVLRIFTLTTQSTTAKMYAELNCLNCPADDSIVLKNHTIQLEAKDHATPYTPSTRVSSIVYDCSGYGIDGTITGSLTIDSNSPRYNKNTKFGGHNCYFLAKNPFYNNVQPCTFAFWFKPNASNQTYNTIISNTSPHNGFWISANTEGRGCWSYNNSTYIHGNSGALTNGQWYHMVWQYKGNNQYQWYLNGNAITTTVSGTEKPPTFSEYLNVGGCQCADSATSSNRYDQYGNMSDLRIYATVLSVDDIKELYNTSAYIYNNGTVASFELTENCVNIAIDVEKARISKVWGNGLSSFTQSNCSCTLTDNGYRIYRPANKTVSEDGNTMWGGLVIDNTDNRFGFQKEHTYMLQFEVKGQTSNNIWNPHWSNSVGWEGGGLIPNPSNVLTANPITENYNSSDWKTFTYKWTISDDVYKVCTSSYSSFVQGNSYISYKGFIYGFIYKDTGSFGTDLYIKNIRMFDVTSNQNIQIMKSGIINSINFVEENLIAEISPGGLVANQLIEI